MLKQFERVSFAGMLVTLGIVYGDIGTSPLYVMNAIVGDAGKMGHTSPDYIIGAISLIFWTLMIITTLKYVVIAMQADNNHEGGIFSLYALVRAKAKWLIFPALIGGAAILADGTLTPAVTVTSAIEGLRGQHLGSISFGNAQSDVLLITTVVLLLLFVIQRFGTSTIGKAFGPVMILWFGFLAVFGIVNILGYPVILKALSPYYAITLLFSPVNKVGIFILGSVFLATTGAEALYSDMGHVGKKNIYATWPLVYGALILNYLGQGAWIINHAHDQAYANLSNLNPFYEMLPGNWRILGIVLATLAAVIASQALITGSFTLVSEAMGLKLLPRLLVKHPSDVKNQIYIANVNWILCIMTLGIVWYFGNSQKMEAAYGLAITVTMLMTTVLLFEFLKDRLNRVSALGIALFFGTIETLFLIASLVKFIHGGYITVLLMLLILYVMWVWYFGNKKREHYEVASEYVPLLDYRDQLSKLSDDETEPFFTTNLVYMTKIKDDYRIKRSAMYSILDRQPKRAKVYWFVTVNETDEPYESSYTVDMLDTDNIVNVQLYLGFKRSQVVSVYLHQIVAKLVEQGVLKSQVPKYSTQMERKVGSFKFVIIKEQPADLVINDKLSGLDRRLIAGRIYLQKITASPTTWYGLEFSNVIEESAPLFINYTSNQYVMQRKIYHRQIKK